MSNNAFKLNKMYTDNISYEVQSSVDPTVIIDIKLAL